MIGPNEQVEEAPSIILASADASFVASIASNASNAIDAAKLASTEAKVIKMKEKKLIAMDTNYHRNRCFGKNMSPAKEKKKLHRLVHL